jgi:Xaa-Pro aminopeptidase
MRKEGIYTYIAVKFDPHLSEYANEYWNEMGYISGFSGSAGYVGITRDHAGLWADGRYHIQAEKEIAGSQFEVHKEGNANVKNIWDWAADITPAGEYIGFDGRCVSAQLARDLEKKLKVKHIGLKTSKDLIGQLWIDRPVPESFPIVEHKLEFAGCSRKDKLAQAREKMREQGADVYIISSLDDIAWLFNLRGGDMSVTTVFSSYAAVTEETATLFAQEDESSDVKQALLADGIALLPYEGIYEYVKTIAPNQTIALAARKNCHALHSLLGKHTIIELKTDITTELKAVKNSTELAGLESVQIRDGVAMARFIMWVEQSKGGVTEFDVSNKINQLRGENQNYINPSFDTIAAFGANGAMMHYSAKEDTAAKVEREGFLLLDSGGQYWDGTTDITRTFNMGAGTDATRRDFTLVLKAHIGLAKAVFRSNATGAALDTFARGVMWANKMDYNSGTGHGVGFCLCVHEGPQGISGRSDYRLKPGHIVTNEPGCYRENAYGIRIENMMLVVEDETNEFGTFYKFKTITYCPIDLSAVEIGMLSSDEREWLNDYHSMVYEKLSPALSEAESLWLKDACRKI